MKFFILYVKLNYEIYFALVQSLWKEKIKGYPHRTSENSIIRVLKIEEYKIVRKNLVTSELLNCLYIFSFEGPKPEVQIFLIPFH